MSIKGYAANIEFMVTRLFNNVFKKDPWIPRDLGLCQPRLEGEEYLSVVDEFMEAVHTCWPKVIVQVDSKDITPREHLVYALVENGDQLKGEENIKAIFLRSLKCILISREKMLVTPIGK